MNFLSIYCVAVIMMLPFHSSFCQTTTQLSTDIFLADMKIEDGKFSFGKMVNITNCPGYDNQPFFALNGKGILFSSIREDNQADIYFYDFEKQTITCVNHTPESEYSPSEYPTYFGYSVVRVEKDGTQHVCAMEYNDSTAVEFNDPDIKNVGYFAEVAEEIDAFYILGDTLTGKPNSLKIVNYRTSEEKTIAENIGRCLKRVPIEYALSFVDKSSNNKWVIKEYFYLNGTIKTIAQTIPGKEDYSWTPPGIPLMGSGSKLYNFHPGTDTKWQEIADFKKDGITDISRIAVNSGGYKIAIVSTR